MQPDEEEHHQNRQAAEGQQVAPHQATSLAVEPAGAASVTRTLR